MFREGLHLTRPPPPPRCCTHAGIQIVGASAGRYNTLLLDSMGSMWALGYDGCVTGQVPALQERWKARRVRGELVDKKVVAFDVGVCLRGGGAGGGCRCVSGGGGGAGGWT